MTGTSVTLCPLRPDDREIEHAFVSGLSPGTRSNRVDDQSAEFAIVVADAVARRHGIKRLHGDILAMNRPMLELARKLGFKLGRHEDPTLTRASLDLPAQASAQRQPRRPESG